MKQQETAQFLAVVKTAFPNFEISEAVVRLWHEYLEDIPFDQAKQNLKLHIKSNRFPPAIADIVRHESGTTHIDLLREETKERFYNLEKWAQVAVDPPKELMQRNRGETE